MRVVRVSVCRLLASVWYLEAFLLTYYTERCFNLGLPKGGSRVPVGKPACNRALRNSGPLNSRERVGWFVEHER